MEKNDVGETKINIPNPGNYEIKTKARYLYKTPIQLCEIDIELPEFERNLNVNIKDFYFSEKQQSPAVIAKTEGIVIVNPKFISIPIEQRICILFHEAGHFYYSTEWKCDVFAVKEFLSCGYNPVSAYLALFSVLKCNTKSKERNERNEKRIDIVYNILANTKNM